MKQINCWRDLEKYGIEVLTGEACSIGYRLLCDCTEKGRQILSEVFGIPELKLAENWNNNPADPHVGSIMLSEEMLRPLGIFALLESGCTEVWADANGRNIIGLEADDDRELIRQCYAPECLRQFCYPNRPGISVGSRNTHQISGRTV